MKMKIVNVGLIACAALVFPLAAFAQSTDADYCKKLGALARTYGANTGPVPEATAKCDSDPKGSIATLEKHLQAEKIKLPPR
jgi:hypothetical protein